MGSSTATDAIAPQRGFYQVSPSTAGTNSSQVAGSGAYSGFNRSGPSTIPDTPFRSPSTPAPKFDTPSNRYGNSGVKDTFVPPSERAAGSSPVGTQGFYPVTSGSTPQRGHGSGNSYGLPNAGNTNPPATSGWGYSSEARSFTSDGTGPAGGGQYSAPPAGADRGLPPSYGPPRGDSRPAPTAFPNAGSEYRPGSTGYQPPASDYRLGQSGYTPPSPGAGYVSPQTGGSYGSPAPGSASPYRYPSTSSAGSGSGITPEDVPYRPGSVTEYPPRSSSPAGSSTPATVTNPWVSPNAYGSGGQAAGVSTGPTGTLR